MCYNSIQAKFEPMNSWCNRFKVFLTLFPERMDKQTFTQDGNHSFHIFLLYTVYDKWPFMVHKASSSNITAHLKLHLHEHCLPLTFPLWLNAAGMFPLVGGKEQEETIRWCLSQTCLPHSAFPYLPSNAIHSGPWCTWAGKRFFIVLHSYFLFDHCGIPSVWIPFLLYSCPVKSASWRVMSLLFQHSEVKFRCK